MSINIVKIDAISFGLVMCFVLTVSPVVFSQQYRRATQPETTESVETAVGFYAASDIRKIRKATPDETVEAMVRRVFGKGHLESTPGEDALGLEERSFNWIAVTYTDGSRWELGIYEFDDHFWLYVKDYFDAAGNQIRAVSDSKTADIDDGKNAVDEDQSLELLGRWTTCAGLSSYDNPYNCCDGTRANCVFAVWEWIRQTWGYKPFTRSWGSPGTWPTNARSAGYTVSSKMCLYCIAQNSAHVAQTVGLNSAGKLIVNEQNCGESYTRYNRVYITNPFSNYIWKKNGQTISISGVQGSLFSSTASQMVWFRISNNYYYNNSTKFLLTFPNGGKAMIGSGYYFNLDKVYIPMVLGARGTWRIQAFYANGDFSNEYLFTVN